MTRNVRYTTERTAHAVQSQRIIILGATDPTTTRTEPTIKIERGSV